MTDTIAEFKARITAATPEAPLHIRGAGTKDWYGQEARGNILDTTVYQGIIDYEPTELVITAKCGTPLSVIDAALAEHHQTLAFEPMRFNGHATIGGMVAAGLSGPARPWAGSVRDFVLGAVLIDGKGDELHFGGQVMKNVAGYDVSRLLTGSLGTLGLITEVSIKVLPQAVAVCTLVFEADEAEAIRLLNTWGGQPLPLSASCWINGVLTVRLSGAQAAVDLAKQKLGGAELINGDDFWIAIREQTHAFFTDQSAPLWRISVPQVSTPLAIDGTLLTEWGGALRWYRTDADASEIRKAATAAGGHATLYRGGDKQVGVFEPLVPAVGAIHRRLKTAFDPSGVFNPGRMYSTY
jgi:glycolate oxidase FAD binding subunit